MLKTVDDKIFSIINRKLPLEKRFKKLTSNARNVLYTLIIKSKNDAKNLNPSHYLVAFLWRLL